MGCWKNTTFIVIDWIHHLSALANSSDSSDNKIHSRRPRILVNAVILLDLGERFSPVLFKQAVL